jgi:hypothetical protein
MTYLAIHLTLFITLTLEYSQEIFPPNLLFLIFLALTTLAVEVVGRAENDDPPR